MDVEKWIEDHHSGKRDEEVVLRGGKPWGFSLQGGCESHAPLTISKVRRGSIVEITTYVYAHDITISIVLL